MTACYGNCPPKLQVTSLSSGYGVGHSRVFYIILAIAYILGYYCAERYQGPLGSEN